MNNVTEIILICPHDCWLADDTDDVDLQHDIHDLSNVRPHYNLRCPYKLLAWQATALGVCPYDEKMASG